MKKKYSITIDDDEIFTVVSRKMEILKAIPIGKKTISSRVGKTLGIKQRRALDYLDELDESDVKSLIFDGLGESKPDGTRSPKKAY